MSYCPLGEPERYRSASRARGTGGDWGTAWGAEWRLVWMTIDFKFLLSYLVLYMAWCCQSVVWRGMNYHLPCKLSDRLI